MRGSDAIRSAQSALVNPPAGILPGPDTDALGFADRYDGCHFSTEGLENNRKPVVERDKPKTGPVVRVD